MFKSSITYCFSLFNLVIYKTIKFVKNNTYSIDNQLITPPSKYLLSSFSFGSIIAFGLLLVKMPFFEALFPPANGLSTHEPNYLSLSLCLIFHGSCPHEPTDILLENNTVQAKTKKELDISLK